MKQLFNKPLLLVLTIALISFMPFGKGWESKFISIQKDGNLKYNPDENGNIIPDFSNVGFYGGDRTIPDITVVKVVNPGNSDDESSNIQHAIDELSAQKPDSRGYRGAILIKKGVYKLARSLQINKSGIILRGEGKGEDATKLIATYSTQDALIKVEGFGEPKEIAGKRFKVKEDYIPTGTKVITIDDAQNFVVGQKIILLRPGTDQWVHDLKMDVMEERDGTKQWTAKEYDLKFERLITRIEGKKIHLDNPVMMPMEKKYGGAEIYAYTFEGRINHIGIENLNMESVYEKDTSENHAWDAVYINRAENSWVRNVNAKYFGYSCVNLGGYARNITVSDSRCSDHKSIITGGRRYSFNNNGQLNLFINCHTSDGRHDFVTGAKTLGPNVFVNCTAAKTHADIGPHHRWSVGTLYDNIITDGEINVQDRGNWGSGHGWAGVTQVIWNCKVKKAAIQNPWVSGKNYCIGLKGDQYDGRLKGRPNAEWEGQNKEGLVPESLYFSQLNAKFKSKKSKLKSN